MDKIIQNRHRKEGWEGIEEGWRVLFLSCYMFFVLLELLPTPILMDRKYYIYIGLAVREFSNGPGDLGSILGRVIPKTQKMVLDASLLNTQHYKVRIKGKVEQSWEGAAPSPTPWCSSYRKGSLRVILDNYIYIERGRELYIYIFDWIE